MGSVVLTAFSVSIIMFQMSCSKSADAQTGTSVTQLNILLYAKETETSPGVRVIEYWTAALDGSNQKKVSITLPAGLSLSEGAKLTPDGKKIIFEASNKTSAIGYIYTCNMDGSAVTKLVDNTTSNSYYYVNGAY